MSSFGDFLTSGNIKVAANRITSSFSKTSYNYVLTYNEITEEIISNAKSAKNSYYIEILNDNKIKNLGELTCLYLNTFIGPKNTSFRQTTHDFREEVRRYLKNEGIPEKYISGDNTDLTEQNYSFFSDKETKFDQDKYRRPVETIKKKLQGLNKFSVIFLILVLTLSYGVFVLFVTTQKSVRNPKLLEKPNLLEKPDLLELHALAKSGDLKSQYRLGLAYEKGNGIQQNDEEAVKWYHKAAEGNHVKAQHKLGYLYYNGRGVSENYVEAFKWFQKASENGHTASQFNLAQQYYFGYGVVADKERSAHWYHKSAMQGESRAQFNLSLQYLHGQGVIKNEEKAQEWMLKSATQGLVNAQVFLGDKYRRVNKLLPKERRVPNDFNKSAYWFRKAAEQGDAQGQYNLSQMDSTLYGAVIRKEEALEWLIKAAEQGHERAQLSLAYLYDEGRGLPNRDDKLATYWYLKAAEQGYSPAQFELGRRYTEGLGVDQSDEKAEYWFSKAIEQGNTHAERELERLLGSK